MFVQLVLDCKVVYRALELPRGVGIANVRFSNKGIDLGPIVARVM